jgi:hypothetical protein
MADKKQQGRSPQEGQEPQQASGSDMEREFGPEAGQYVESAVRRYKEGTLRTSAGEKVTSRDQAIAIGLSEAQEQGIQVPERAGQSGGRSGRWQGDTKATGGSQGERQSPGRGGEQQRASGRDGSDRSNRGQ